MSSCGTDGLLVPGRRLRDHNLAAQGLRLDPAAVPGRRAATWQRFLELVRGWPHDAVISNEWLTRTTPEQAARALAALAPAEVHVVVTARDLSAQAPAAWQESVKVGHSASLEEFIAELDSSTARWTWASLDPARVLETWAGLVPVERLHVVTVPAHGADPALLWQRVGSLLGLLDPAGYDATRKRTNESLSAEAAALMWRIGPGLREAVTDGGAAGWVEPFRWVRNYVSHDLLAAYAGSRISLRPAEHDLVSKRSELIAHELVDAGYDLVGDLADLRPARAARGRSAPRRRHRRGDAGPGRDGWLPTCWPGCAPSRSAADPADRPPDMLADRCSPPPIVSTC